MLVNEKIVATYQIDPGEEGVRWATGELRSDGRRSSVECEMCGRPGSYRFEPTDPQAAVVYFCLDDLVSQPDVIKIVIGDED